MRKFFKVFLVFTVLVSINSQDGMFYVFAHERETKFYVQIGDYKTAEEARAVWERFTRCFNVKNWAWETGV